MFQFVSVQVTNCSVRSFIVQHLYWSFPGWSDSAIQTSIDRLVILIDDFLPLLFI